ncbi:UDP-glucose 4-epimerase GalE [Porphyrobacter sp. LM 6]|uniref:UDP-glucose 4-epimerase GalE n=1 Tax=Porphyrobacter sp. LM 6 TaxID=1896196 RepID=UPI0008470DA3|nr:UDP-glucose 4-epimerase GalE [Porphyrobacter sp. LM 6]AOL94058.1 UDP-glucose 4-epimerase [Porphyrobacter sp. LM 6]
MRILLTGGAGYIGSHTAVALAATGHEVVCFDNLSNSRAEVMDQLETITGQSIPLIVGDIRDRTSLEQAMQSHAIEAVIHFAGLKAVGEAVARPLIYYDNNVRGTLSLIEAMIACSVRTLVFSSSATVYGEPQYLPLDEIHPTSATNPYGRTKLMIEEMLTDIAAADPDWRIAVLRYFNPVGAHESGLIGEDPNGIPNNLMPFISRVASGRLERLSVFGDDYDTPDGTGVRDYIHVTDLAAGHLAALGAISSHNEPISTWNLGTGQGYSVLEMVRAFERVNGVCVPYQIADRRPGDVASCYASPDKAKAELGWEAALGLEDMCSSMWRFERMLATSNSPQATAT